MPRITTRRRASSHSGNASRRLISAVRCNRGSIANRIRAISAATSRARARGNRPSTFKIAHTAAYSTHALIRLSALTASTKVSYALTFARTNARLSSSVTTPALIAPGRKTMAARIAWAALICGTLYVCYFSHLGAIGFVGPDEPRYAWIARDMAETGDWVTPRLYGQPWFEKPPLYYWAAAICFKLFGVSEAAARLPSAISALLATLAMAWLAWRLYGPETARWLLLLLPTTVGMIGFSHAAATDMPFAAMLTVAMICAAVVLGLIKDGNTPILPRTPWLALLLFGFFLGLAALAKGPAAIVLSGGSV